MFFDLKALWLYWVAVSIMFCFRKIFSKFVLICDSLDHVWQTMFLISMVDLKFCCRLNNLGGYLFMHVIIHKRKLIIWTTPCNYSKCGAMVAFRSFNYRHHLYEMPMKSLGTSLWGKFRCSFLYYKISPNLLV